MTSMTVDHLIYRDDEENNFGRDYDETWYSDDSFEEPINTGTSLHFDPSSIYIEPAEPKATTTTAKGPPVGTPYTVGAGKFALKNGVDISKVTPSSVVITTPDVQRYMKLSQ